jgi:hypothetical protein
VFATGHLEEEIAVGNALFGQHAHVEGVLGTNAVNNLHGISVRRRAQYTLSPSMGGWSAAQVLTGTRFKCGEGVVSPAFTWQLG